jgi:dTDP-glucose pyrophosphorylase/predicted transcriptional regulator
MTSNSESQDWRSTLVPMGATIQQAIHSLENSCMQIVLAVSDENKLLGTITDGDIRRGLLKGLKLECGIDEVMYRSPLVVPQDIGRELVLQLMQANKIHQLPVVDREGVVVGLHLWESIVSPTAIDNPMVIMAGGRGTRLGSHTENCPKPMLEVGGKPMLQHIIERAVADGFQKFIISLHYLGNMIEEYFGDGNKWGVSIEYLREDSPLGTAGCLSIISNEPRVPFIVTNGDVLTDIRYSDILDFHVRHNAIATMAVRQYEMQNQFGVVKTKGVEIEGFEEKPIYRSHINAGIYVLNPVALTYLETKQYCDMPILFERIKMKAGRIIVYPMHEPWLDVGRPDDLVLAQKQF